MLSEITPWFAKRWFGVRRLADRNGLILQGFRRDASNPPDKSQNVDFWVGRMSSPEVSLDGYAIRSKNCQVRNGSLQEILASQNI
ncbi:hypothetical protein A0H81_06506 [Grifola frondosa]|uniref:Uncharacterized protein n=1 Tax=Grifola frondosa TaxID=5627 RepID=A0A1C7M9M4_GRIFR|nr:hypothetical protein A0H81_06506 [Grifola frondosa]